MLHVTSRATDRRTYLQRPDLGRRLDEASARQLAAAGGRELAADDRTDIAVVIADGLSALAVLRYAAPPSPPCCLFSKGSGSLRWSSPLKAAWPWPTKWEPCSERGWR